MEGHLFMKSNLGSGRFNDWLVNLPVKLKLVRSIQAQNSLFPDNLVLRKLRYVTLVSLIVFLRAISGMGLFFSQFP